VHRDVKPENVLLTETGVPKLADFGLCCALSDEKEMARRCGSPGYIAPEIWLKEPYDEKVDIFAVGAVLYFVIAGRMPYDATSMKSLVYKTIHSPVNFQKSMRLECLSVASKVFIRALLWKKPDSRPSAQEALDMLAHSSHPGLESAGGTDAPADASWCLSDFSSESTGTSSARSDAQTSRTTASTRASTKESRWRSQHHASSFSTRTVEPDMKKVYTGLADENFDPDRPGIFTEFKPALPRAVQRPSIARFKKLMKLVMPGDKQKQSQPLEEKASGFLPITPALPKPVNVPTVRMHQYIRK
jgi:serine/threonine protein kinase